MTHKIFILCYFVTWKSKYFKRLTLNTSPEFRILTKLNKQFLSWWSVDFSNLFLTVPKLILKTKCRKISLLKIKFYLLEVFEKHKMSVGHILLDSHH